jgi:outer membrane immunogenic protein
VSRVRRYVTAILLFILAPRPGFAADLFSTNPYLDSAASRAVYDWTGFYVGANLGLAEASSEVGDVTGAVGGAQAGYLVESGDFVVGLEVDASLAGLDRSSGAAEISVDVLGSGRARAGYSLGSILLYGTGGFGFGQIEVDRPGHDQDTWRSGWVVGLGAEADLGRSWTARLEAFHYDIGSNDASFETNVLRAAVNYRF